MEENVKDIEKITKEMRIGDILQQYPTTMNFLETIKIHIPDYTQYPTESLEDVCEIHGLDTLEIVAKINKHLDEERFK